MKKNLAQGALILLFSILIACQPSAQTGGLQNLDAAAFATQLDACDHAVILDVRTPEEFATGYIHGAVNYNIYDADFDQRIAKISKDKAVFVYCKAGGRSAEAAAKLIKLGFTEVYDLKGGVMAWTAKGNGLEGQSTSTPDQYTTAQFHELLEQHDAVLVDFYAPWCMPCKKMEPGLNAFAKTYDGKVAVVRIDVDQAKSLVKELGLSSVPVITTYSHGQLVKQVEGYQSDDAIRALIEEVLPK